MKNQAVIDLRTVEDVLPSELQLELPDASLGTLIQSERVMSDGYTYLLAVAHMIYNMAIYLSQENKNLKNALWIIGTVRKDLVLAEMIFEEDLANLLESNHDL